MIGLTGNTMKLVQKSSLILTGLLFISLNANAEVFDGLGGKNFKHPPMDGPAVPAGKLAPGAKAAMPAAAPMPTNMQQPEGPAAQGKILEATSAAGYTYMLLESGGKQFWVAGTQVTAKKGDVVSYVTNVTMQNFTSKTMKKTFDSIIFASSVSVVP